MITVPEPLWLLVWPVLGVAGGQGVGEAEAVAPVPLAAGAVCGAGEEAIGPVRVLGVEGRLVRRRQAEELLASRLYVPHRLLRHAVVDHLIEAARFVNGDERHRLRGRLQSWECISGREERTKPAKRG